MNSEGHVFGGDWTDEKLRRVCKYLSAYRQVMKGKPFRCAYIDAFAGTGYRVERKRAGEQAQDELFPELGEDEPEQFRDGSARVALKTAPPFDQYIFIESDAEKCAKLELLKDEFPTLAGSISIKNEECNEYLQALAAKNWSMRRAVLFLDPYGMQVPWETMVALASTKAIDVWVLFPLGMGVNRMLKRTGAISPAWSDRLDVVFGTHDWYDRFYSVDQEDGLWGRIEQVEKVADFETIAKFYNERLKTIFPGVAENPLMLRNSTRSPLYLLCFACGNPRAKKVALDIAQHILKDPA